MSDPKEIAENIVESYHNHGPNFTLDFEDAAKIARAYLELKAENEKLKKSREGLRSALKDLSLPLTRTDYTVGQLDKITCDIAENSLKADDEIMKGE